MISVVEKVSDVATLDDVPEGWAIVPFLDVIDYEGGSQPPKKEFVYEPKRGYVRLLQIRDFGDKPFPTYVPDSTRLKKTNADDLLLARYGGGAGDDCLGRICTGLAGAYNVALVKLKFPRHLIDGGFVKCFFLGTWFKEAISVNSRSCQQGFNRDDLKLLTFSLAPLAEQKRIVAKVEALLARVNAARERLAKAPVILKRFRQAVLAAACSGRLTEGWRETNPVRESGVDLLEGIWQQRKRAYAEEIKRAAAEGRRKPRAPELFEDFESISESELPSTWATCAIGAIFSVETGATPLRKRKEYYERGTVPWVKTGEVQNCEILSAEENITELAVRDTNAKVFREGTILIAMYGEGKTRGQVGRLRITAATNQACAALVNSAIPQELNDYVYLFCLSQYQTIRQEAVGGNQPNLNLEKVKTWQISLPPLVELREIVCRVEALFKLADAIEKRVAAATIQTDRLTQAILAKAFRGELVPTEADLARREGRDYETAAQLIVRIKAERDSGTTSLRCKFKGPEYLKGT